MRAIFLYRVSVFLRVALTTWVLLFAFNVGGASTWAQSTPPVAPADVQKIFSNIGDLDLLKTLVPLHLTTAQIDKLQAQFKDIAANNEARRKADYEALRAIASEVTKAHEAALKGENLSVELENKILSTFNAADDRFAKSKKLAIDKIFGVVKEDFTSEQKDEVERQIGKLLGGKRLIPKEYQKDPKKAPKDAVQDLALQMYVERILIADRVPDILAQMKAATATTAAAPAKTEPSKP